MSSKEPSIVETHREKIYPWVKVTISDEDNSPPEMIFTEANSPVKRNWLGNLIILYVADMGDRFQVILQQDLSENITEESLYEIAVNNLSNNIEFKVYETNFGSQGLTAGGDHEAGSICLPGIWDYLAGEHNDNLIVAIPSKDLIAFVPETDSNNIDNLKIFVHEVFKNGERLLTKNIFRYDKESTRWSIIDTVKPEA
jgi:uncharacterized protein YtpQ (UPF0354 family)